jgi:two-component system sensor histidine kinase UhpB
LGVTFRLSSIRKRAIKRSSPEDGANLLLNDLDLVRRDLLDVVSQLRGMIAELRPAGLEELGLHVALEGYVEQLRRMNHLPVSQTPEVRFQIDEALAFLSEPLSICVFRVAQEALRNAFQHAQATQITVQVSDIEGHLHLVVQDDGCGFQVPGRLSEFTQGNHYGLVGMWERIRAAGGELSIQSAPGQGARLTAVFPVEEVQDGS